MRLRNPFTRAPAEFKRAPAEKEQRLLTVTEILRAQRHKSRNWWINLNDPRNQGDARADFWRGNDNSSTL